MSIIVSSGNRQTPNQYIIDVINAKKRQTSITMRDYRIKGLISDITSWAGRNYSDLFVSGSSAKGTALQGSSDLDLFLSLKPTIQGTLGEIFTDFSDTLKRIGYDVRPQNVSVRLKHYGLQIDIVPGKKLPNTQDWHFLYTNRRENQNRIQTNVNRHINAVVNSGRVNEIMVLKIWRDINRLDLPSMYLEMYVLKLMARKWSGKGQLTENFLFLLEEIARNFPNVAVYDPSSSTNTISHDLLKSEKQTIQRAATRTLENRYLADMIY
jgi:hypothetical protein